MKRVVILGPGGAGKSTLARRLGERTGLPVVHLDREYWLPNWIEPTAEAFDAKVDTLIASERWILDGNFGRTLVRRVEAADTIVMLDVPPWRCVLSALRRRIRHHGRTRPDMTPGCAEKIDLEFVQWIWRYRLDSLPGILAKIAPLRTGRTVCHFHSRGEAKRWLASLPVAA